ncbi:Hypothetical predicted protein, partial [Pelobates cultripes]
MVNHGAPSANEFMSYKAPRAKNPYTKDKGTYTITDPQNNSRRAWKQTPIVQNDLTRLIRKIPETLGSKEVSCKSADRE